jgi:hypothetical protein
VIIKPDAMPKVLELYLELTQYPTLAPLIRQRMRAELFARGVISPGDFEQEIKNKAMLSQEREGLRDPLTQEPEDVWQARVEHYRENLTDFYFGHNLPHSRFEQIVHDVLAKRLPEEDIVLTFNPELSPWSLIFERGETYERLPPAQRQRVRHHLREIIVVLIKGLVSDQLAFVGIAKDLFGIADLKNILSRRIGRGKIGGKAAGMLLAWKMLNLQREDQDGGPEDAEMADLRRHVVLPESYFVGADVVYDFIALNNLHHLNDQKYKSRAEIEADYPKVREAFIGGRFPEPVVDSLRELLAQVGDHPLIVRSSSLLEDNWGTSFAGKYDSVFCPNQGSPKENLKALLLAISKVYASVFSPDALFYRQQMGLLDYDERMAILLQEVQGERHGDYFFPTLAGVAFSHNPFRWTAKIRSEEGFMRLVWGLGTRAVERVGHDYPRMVALSHPGLRPVASASEARHYSQHYADAINLATNRFETVPVASLLTVDFPAARLLVSVDRGDYLQPPVAYEPGVAPHDLVLTFENLLTRTRFVPLFKALLRRLADAFGCNVDIEFTVDIIPGYPEPDFRIHLLQCRPQAAHQAGPAGDLPTTVTEASLLFRSDRLVPQGRVQRIRYAVYVDPRAYNRLPDETTRLEIARVVGRLNQVLAGQRFILIGPGRWGSNNASLGVKATYADIYNTSMLIEIGLSDGGSAEPSYGTHFFQDLVEAHIYPLALYPEAKGSAFSWEFFEKSPNALASLLPERASYAPYVRVVDIPAVASGQLLEVIMDGEKSEALGFLRTYPEGQAG